MVCKEFFRDAEDLIKKIGPNKAEISCLEIKDIEDRKIDASQTISIEKKNIELTLHGYIIGGYILTGRIEVDESNAPIVYEKLLTFKSCYVQQRMRPSARIFEIECDYDTWDQAKEDFKKLSGLSL